MDKGPLTAGLLSALIVLVSACSSDNSTAPELPDVPDPPAEFICAGDDPNNPVSQNPLFSSEEFADPHVILHEGTYYMYGTSSPNDHYDVFTSADMCHWAKGPEVLRIGSDNMWAPDVYYHALSGLFIMWYSADYRIGLAVANSPLGPFVDQGIRIKNAIDAFLYKDVNGDFYLYYEAITKPINLPEDLPVIGKIWVQPMYSPTQFGPERPSLAIQPDQDWEIFPFFAQINEGPWVFHDRGTYYLMYSGNIAGAKEYAVGYATGPSPMGPWIKYPGNPILSYADGLYGPGHHSIAPGPDGNLYIFYHQKVNDEFLDFERYPAVDKFTIEPDGSLSVEATPFRPGVGRGNAH